MAADADAQKFWNTEWRGLGQRGRAQSQADELLRPGWGEAKAAQARDPITGQGVRARETNRSG